MTATFQPNLSRTIDRVRQYLGDKNLAAPLVQDETITALLAEQGATVLSVSASLAHSIVAEYAHRVTYDVDGQGERFSDLVKNYRLIAADLQAKADAEAATIIGDDQIAASQALGGGIMVGGLSRRKNVARSDDTDRAANFSPAYTGGLDE